MLLTQAKLHFILLEGEGRLVTWDAAGGQADTHGAWGRERKSYYSDKDKGVSTTNRHY